MKIKLCLFFFCIANIILAQESSKSVLNGKISANIIDLDGVYVINLRTEKSSISQKDGSFSIEAVPGDILLFSAIQLKESRIVLKKEDFQGDLFLVKMELGVTQLREVIVKRYDNINAVSLGISRAGIKHLTQAERHLKTATGLNPTASAGTMAGGSVSLDPLLNLLSGRTAMLKKELEVEKKNSYIQLLGNMFDEDYFKKTLKIPAEYVKGFQYYIVENERFTTVLNSKNKTNIEFLMIGLAENYNKMISGEK